MEDTILQVETREIYEGQYIPDLYPEGLPSNTILNKVLTGSRATTCELEAKRNSIIIEPNLPVIDGKQQKYPKILGVREGVYEPKIKAYLLDVSIPFKKILVTPESYQKVKNAAHDLGIDIFRDYFLLIDECEKAVQDADFRKDIMLPYFDLFEYENKCLISATPLIPNLKGFENHSFKIVNIEPQFDYQKDLSIIATNNITIELLKCIQSCKHKLAIFINEIDYPKRLIEKAGIKECSKIYTSKGELKDLLNEGYKAASQFIKDEVLEQYSFFTSRYYSAVDLETPDKPDIIMVTNCHKPQTMIDPFTHAVQIVGRFRLGIGDITHITNWNGSLIIESREKLLSDADAAKKVYDLLDTLKETIKGREREVLEEAVNRISIFIFKEGRFKGSINPFLLECYIQKSKVTGYYKYYRLLEQAYRETGHFNVSCQYIPHDKEDKDDTQTKRKNLSKVKKLEILERLKILIPTTRNFFIPTNEQDVELSSLWEEAPELCHFYQRYGIQELEEINYDLTKMKKLLKQGSKDEVFFIPLDEIYDTFDIGKIYPEKEIVETLQRIYDKYELEDDKGKRLIAKAAFLQKYYEPCERVAVSHSRAKGYLPLKKKYAIK